MTPTTKQISPGKRVGLGVIAVVQIAYHLLAFWDLGHRPASQIRGPKLLWMLIIPLNWIGPTAYFYAHRHR